MVVEVFSKSIDQRCLFSLKDAFAAFTNSIENQTQTIKGTHTHYSSTQTIPLAIP